MRLKKERKKRNDICLIHNRPPRYSNICFFAFWGTLVRQHSISVVEHHTYLSGSESDCMSVTSQETFCNAEKTSLPHPLPHTPFTGFKPTCLVMLPCSRASMCNRDNSWGMKALRRGRVTSEIDSDIRNQSQSYSQTLSRQRSKTGCHYFIYSLAHTHTHTWEGKHPNTF